MQPFDDPTQPADEPVDPTPDAWTDLPEPSPDVVNEAELDQLDEEVLVAADELSDEFDEEVLVAADEVEDEPVDPAVEPVEEVDEVLLVAVEEPEAPVTAAESPIDGRGEPQPVSPTATPGLDLDAIAADLDGVEVALARLAEGTYWSDEVTGEPLPPELLAESPTARRAG